MIESSLVYLSAYLLVISAIISIGCSQPIESPANASGMTNDTHAKKLAVISLTSDPESDPQAVNMGLTFAGFCVDEGYDVAIFFNVKGTRLATKEFPTDFKYLEHAPLQVQLKSLKERGVELHVCPVCMKDLNIAEGSIIEEAFVTSKPKLFARLGPETMVFTY